MDPPQCWQGHLRKGVSLMRISGCGSEAQRTRAIQAALRINLMLRLKGTIKRGLNIVGKSAGRSSPASGLLKGAKRSSGKFHCFLLGVVFALVVQVLLKGWAQSLEDGDFLGVKARENATATAAKLKPGGEFDYIPLPLVDPALLPPLDGSLGGPQWFFEGASVDLVRALLGGCSTSPELHKQLNEPSRWRVETNGVRLQPPPQFVLELKSTDRARIYSILALSPVNSAQCCPFRFRPDSFDHWLKGVGLSEEHGEVIRRLLYPHNGSLCLSDGNLLQAMLPADEFQRVVQSLYGDNTFLMRLRVTKETDVEELINYWGKGGRAKLIRPLLLSLKRSPVGGNLSISHLLPLLARTCLYTYDEPKGASGIRYNCSWSTMNFFRDKPDDRFVDFDYTMHAIQSDFEEVHGLPAFGDAIALFNAEDKPVHFCVYLADGVVFTKNGYESLQPWVLMKLTDVISEYQARADVRTKVYRDRKK